MDGWKGQSLISLVCASLRVRVLNVPTAFLKQSMHSEIPKQPVGHKEPVLPVLF